MAEYKESGAVIFTSDGMIHFDFGKEIHYMTLTVEQATMIRDAINGCLHTIAIQNLERGPYNATTKH